MRTRNRTRGGGFTLIEVTLAVLLSSMVIIASLSLFATLEGSQKRHEIRMERALEMAGAQAAMRRALSSLVMSDEQEPGEGEVERLRENDRRRAEGETEHSFEITSLQSRFSLQPQDAENGGMSIDGIPLQRLQLAVRTPPVAGGGATDGETEELMIDSRGRQMSGDEIRAMKREKQKLGGLAGIAERRASRIAATNSRTAAVRETGTSSGGFTTAVGELERMSIERSEVASTKGRVTPGGGGGGGGGGADTGRAGGISAGDAAAAAAAAADAAGGGSSIPGLEDLTDPALAPGLRGVFEILPDVSSKRPGESIVGTPVSEHEEAGLALWWRELRPINAMAGTNQHDQAAVNLRADELRRAEYAGAQATRIKLLGGLKAAEWRVLRSNREYRKMSARWAGELPAHVEFRFETLAGSREDWMFEVAWSNGPEPGAPLSGGTGVGGTGVGGVPLMPSSPRVPAGGDGGGIGTNRTP